MSPFIESIRVVIRTKQYSLKTEKSYLYWARYFIRFHQLKHPNEMGNKEVGTFLSHLAAKRRCPPKVRNALDNLPALSHLLSVTTDIQKVLPNL